MKSSAQYIVITLVVGFIALALFSDYSLEPDMLPMREIKESSAELYEQLQRQQKIVAALMREQNKLQSENGGKVTVRNIELAEKYLVDSNRDAPFAVDAQAPEDASGNDVLSLSADLAILRDLASIKFVKVFYATDRGWQFTDDNIKTYNSKRAEDMSYGACWVTIPPNHKIGNIESPSIFRFEFSENAERHITLAKIDTFNSFEEFIFTIDNLNKKRAFIFVHGYNVDFEEAAKRTAQMAADLQFSGVPIFYSWPSHGSLFPYVGDENNVEWSTPHIEKFLADVMVQLPEHQIYLIGHSMGTRGLTRALERLSLRNPAVMARINEIILAAPDIDADVFVEQIMPVFNEAKLPVTMYTSSGDRALLVSKFLHKHKRAGLATLATNSTQIDVIDAADMAEDFLGHSYFADEVPLLNDMHYLIEQKLRADKRFMLQKIESTDGFYWKLKH